MTRTFSNRRYLDALADHVVVFDGAMGTSIQKLNLTAADFGGEKLWHVPSRWAQRSTLAHQK